MSRPLNLTQSVFACTIDMRSPSGDPMKKYSLGAPDHEGYIEVNLNTAMLLKIVSSPRAC